MTDNLLIVPGFRGSGPAHWQSWLECQIPGSQRIEGIDWFTPSLPRWAERIGRAIDAATQPLWIVAHSFGCLATAAAIAQQPRKIAGVVLVAPADPERFAVSGLRNSGDRVPEASITQLLPPAELGVNGLLIASRNDPWLTLDDARNMARRWRLPLFNAGEAGHINTESGFGPWPLLVSLLYALQFDARSSAGNVVAMRPQRSGHSEPPPQKLAYL
ncbi:MAG: alpha/beta hydrolase [Porticoccaceae bacterium]